LSGTNDKSFNIEKIGVLRYFCYSLSILMGSTPFWDRSRTLAGVKKL